jgi:hypothetical protein
MSKMKQGLYKLDNKEIQNSLSTDVQRLSQEVDVLTKKVIYLEKFKNEEVEPFMKETGYEIQELKNTSIKLKIYTDEINNMVQDINNKIKTNCLFDYILIFLGIFLFMYIMIILLI